MFRILVFQDKLGITAGYRPKWLETLLAAGLMGPEFKYFYEQSYRHFHQSQLLMWKGNRKSPGFHEDPAKQIKLLRWMWDCIKLHNANVILLMDPALFFIVNQEWDQATTEKLRGGVYEMKSEDRLPIPVFVTAPISSINKGMKPKDIAALNNGFAEKDEWDDVYGDESKVQKISGADTRLDDESEDESEDDEETHVMQWYAPVVIPYGKFCFTHDIAKMGRVLRQRALESRS